MNDEDIILEGINFVKLRSIYSNKLDECASDINKWKFQSNGENFLLKQYKDTSSHRFGISVLKLANKIAGNQHLISEDYFIHKKRPSLIFSYIEGTILNSLDSDICYNIGQKLVEFHEKTNLTHGDFHKGNIIKTTYNALAIIDMDLMGPRNFEYDVAMLLFYELIYYDFYLNSTVCHTVLLFYELIYQESNRKSILRNEVESLFKGYNNNLSNDLIKEEIENIIKVSEHITNNNLRSGIFSKSRVEYRNLIYGSVRKKLDGNLFDAFHP